MSSQISLNDTQRLYVIPSGSGFSCYGYDNCFRDNKALAEKMGLPELAPKEEEIGTLKQYEQHGELIKIASTRDLGTWFTPGTPPEVEHILEDARRSKQRLRITLGDRETGKQWGDRAMVGAIGRSMGPMRVPLLISSRRSHGGQAILTDCIVKIETSLGKQELYRHPNLHSAEMEATTSAPAP